MNNCKIFFTNVWWSVDSVDKPAYSYIQNKFKNISWEYEGFINIVNPQTATIRVKFKTPADVEDEFNYLVIKENDIIRQKSYWYIENYRILSNEMYEFNLRRDIWTMYCASVMRQQYLKDNGKIFLKRANIQRYKKDKAGKLSYNDKWSLFLGIDKLDNIGGFLGSERIVIKGVAVDQVDGSKDTTDNGVEEIWLMGKR